jgi:hypothetical protein
MAQGSVKNVTAARWVLLGALVFGIGTGIFIGIMTGSGYYGFHGGFFSGFAFGFVLHLFLKKTSTQLAAEMMDGEEVLLAGPANHFKGIEAVGGRLTATASRLRFRSHGFNVQTHDESYPLESIASVEAARSLGIVPNAIVVSLADGRRERFVVSGRARWLETLQARIRRSSSESRDRS